MLTLSTILIYFVYAPFFVFGLPLRTCLGGCACAIPPCFVFVHECITSMCRSTSTDSLSCSPRLFLPLSRLSMLVHSLDLVILPHFRLSIHFCFLSTSSRLYLLCLSCRRRYINSSSIYVLVHTRLLSLFIHAHIRLFIYLYPCLFICGKHSLIWFYGLSLVFDFCFLSTSSSLVFYPLC